MWLDNKAPESVLFVERLVPNQVLYFYDGPILFTMKMGFFDVLVYKVDEDEDLELFLLKQTSEEEIDRLRQGRLSLRGALKSERYWLAETKGRLQVNRNWMVALSDLPEAYMPQSGLGLAAGQKRLPDTLLQSDAFFSVKFKGHALGRRQISFKLFKNLVDQFYIASDRLLRPDAAAGLRDREAFDLPMMEPQFASLLIALREPKVDVALVNARNRRRGIPMVDKFDEELTKRRDAVFNAFADVAMEAKKGQISNASAVRHFAFLEIINNLLPSADESINSTEFHSNDNLSQKNVYFDQEMGMVLRSAFSRIQAEPRSIIGRIEIINTHSSTFVIRDLVSHRPITCHPPREWFERHQNSQLLRNGSIVEVHGPVLRRKNRDLLMVWREPVFKGLSEADAGNLF